MLQDIRKFNGGLNSDSIDEELPVNDYRNAQCLRSAATESGDQGGAENILGNTLIPNSLLPSGINVCVGSCADVKRKALIYFVFNNNSAYHTIYSLNTVTDVITILLRGSVLNFKMGERVKGNVIGDVLFWNDNYNPPRKVSILNAISGSYTTLAEEMIDVIQYPPIYPPSAIYGDDSGFGKNLVHGKLWQFAYYWIMDNDEKTTLSPFSKQPLPFNEETSTGEYVGDINVRNNVIYVTVSTGTDRVKKIVVCAREGNLFDEVQSGKGDWFEIEEINKADVFTADLVVKFYNSKNKKYVGKSEQIRLHDNVPLLAETQEAVIDRVMYGNPLMDYDNIDVNMSFTHDSEQVNVIPDSLPMTINSIDTNPEHRYTITSGLRMQSPTVFIGGNYRWDNFGFKIINLPDYVSGLTYLITIKDMSGILQSFACYADGVLIASTEDVRDYLYNSINSVFSGLVYKDSLFGFTFYQEEYWSGYVNTPPQLTPSQLAIQEYKRTHRETIFGTVVGSDLYEYYVGTISAIATEEISGKYTDFKFGARHEFAISYHDKGNRSSSAQQDDNIVDIPIMQADRRSIINFAISHRPPLWATDWQLLYTKNTSIEWFIQLPLLTISTSGNEILVDVNTNIRTYRDGFKKCIIPEYIWQKGDRIRFLSKKSGGVYNHILKDPSWGSVIDGDHESKFFDFEIVGVDYAAGTWQDIVNQAGANADAAKVAAAACTTDRAKGLAAAAAAGLEGIALTLLLENNFDYASAGIVGANVVIVEVYRPKKEFSEKTFYEIGEVHPILNPGTNLCSHGVIGGTDQSSDLLIPAVGTLREGDCYLINRTIPSSPSISYPCQSPSFSDFYISDSYSVGRPNVINTNAKQRRYNGMIVFSDRYLQDTTINGLTSFRSENKKILSDVYGAINSLTLQGFTLKVKQEFKNSSIDVGKQLLYNADGTTNLVTTNSVLGDIRPSLEVFGCSHGHSVCDNGRQLYFIDINSNSFLRDSANGLFAISGSDSPEGKAYKMITHFKELSKLLKRFSASDVICEFDGENYELNVSVKGIEYPTVIGSTSQFVNLQVNDATLYSAGDTVLVDVMLGTLVQDHFYGTVFGVTGNVIIVTNTNGYSFSVSGREDITLTKNIETITFSELDNRWKTSMPYNPESYGRFGSIMYSFVNGQIWKHNVNAVHNNFYGVQYPQWVETDFNINGGQTKVFNVLKLSTTLNNPAFATGWSAEFSIKPDALNTLGMYTYLLPGNFENKDGLISAEIKQNTLTPNTDPALAIINGEDMRGRVVRVKLTNNYTGKVVIYFAEVDCQLSMLT